MKKVPLPFTAEDVRTLLSYDQQTGELTYLPRANKQFNSRSAGRRADSPNANGYAEVKLFGRLYKAHRLIWLIMTGMDPFPLEIDHLDQNKLNNTWSNLRLTRRQENVQNTRRTNLTGFRGVYRKSSKARGKPFGAVIRISGKVKSLGRFDTPEEAHAAYRAAALLHYGPNACIE